jgi:hypothetical protein
MRELEQIDEPDETLSHVPADLREKLVTAGREIRG